MSGSIVEVWLKQSLSDAEIAKIPELIKRLNVDSVKAVTNPYQSDRTIEEWLKSTTTVLDFLLTYFKDKPEYKSALLDWQNRMRMDLRNTDGEIDERGFEFEHYQHLLNSEDNDRCIDMSVYVDFDDFGLVLGGDALLQRHIFYISNVLEALLHIPSTAISILSLFTAHGLCALDMAYIAIEIAKEFDGLIYIYCGVNPIPEPILQGKVANNDWDTQQKLWKIQNNDWIRNFVKQFPGKIIEIKRGTSIFGDEEDDYNLSHLVDVEFMEAWMKHPGFRVCRQ